MADVVECFSSDDLGKLPRLSLLEQRLDETRVADDARLDARELGASSSRTYSTVTGYEEGQ